MLKYRTSALFLALVFGLFNVGLPIVVASCPMTKYTASRLCVMCNDGSSTGTLSLKRAIDTSCCETKFASERNTTQFLQSKHAKDFSQLVIEVPTSVIFLLSNQSAEQGLLATDSSPPLTRDIPVLISSFLI